MFTIRNIGGVSLFLFGTTFMWLTPAFASKGISTKGAWWTVTNVLALLVIAGISVATWGLYHDSSWWESLALWFTALGVLTLVPYWIATQDAGEATGPVANVVSHLAMSAGVFVLLLVPTLEHWVSQHVSAGH